MFSILSLLDCRADLMLLIADRFLRVYAFLLLVGISAKMHVEYPYLNRNGSVSYIGVYTGA